LLGSREFDNVCEKEVAGYDKVESGPECDVRPPIVVAADTDKDSILRWSALAANKTGKATFLKFSSIKRRLPTTGRGVRSN
jgi:hypothetical protein